MNIPITAAAYPTADGYDVVDVDATHNVKHAAFTGETRKEVARKILQYNRFLNEKRCESARDMIAALLDGEGQPCKKEIVQEFYCLVSGLSDPADAKWFLLNRLAKIRDWDDHVGMADLVKVMVEKTNGHLFIGATQRDSAAWCNKIRAAEFRA